MLIRSGTWSFFEHLAIPDEALPGIGCELKILSQFNRVYRTGVFTKAAKHAAREIVSERGQHLVFGLRVAFTANDDQLLGTGYGAQIAGYAERLSVIGIDVQTRSAPVPFSDFGALGRILFGIDFARLLLPESHPETGDEIQKQQLTNPFAHQVLRAPSMHAPPFGDL
jgi:hypothetical protein